MSLHTLFVSTLPLAGLGVLWSLGSGPKAQTIAAEQGRQVTEKPAENVPWQRPAEEEIKCRLTPLQYTVTQEAGTELPFRNCQVPCDYIPRRSYPLLQAREVLRLLAGEGAEGNAKLAEGQIGSA